MTLNVTAAPDSLTGRPRVRVDVASSPAVTDIVTVYRVHQDGARYRVITDQPPVMVTAWSGYDYHAPFNEMFSYVADTGSQTSTASAPVFLPSDASWLISASDPALSLSVPAVLSIGSLSWDDPAQKFQPLDAPRPVHYTSRPRSGPAYSLSVECTSDEEAQMIALIKPGGPILLNLRRPEPTGGWMWVQLSNPTLQPPAGNWRTSVRMWHFSAEETTQPNVDLTAEWDFDGLAAAFPDFDSAAAAYADFRSMALDVRL